MELGKKIPTIIFSESSPANTSRRFSMILGARESWWSLRYNESKNIKNLRLLFARDDFEKTYFQIIDEISLILLTFWDTIRTWNYLIKKTQNYILSAEGAQT